MRNTVFAFALLAASGFAGAAPDTAMKDLDGKTHTLEQYKGKWVVVNYWATWCPPCLEELPELVLFHEKHKDKDAVVIGVNYEDVDRGKLTRFIDEYFVTYPIIPDGPKVPPVGKIPGLPTTYVINPKGEIAARRVGPVTSDQIEQFIKGDAPKTAQR